MERYTLAPDKSLTFISSGGFYLEESNISIKAIGLDPKIQRFEIFLTIGFTTQTGHHSMKFAFHLEPPNFHNQILTPDRFDPNVFQGPYQMIEIGSKSINPEITFEISFPRELTLSPNEKIER